MRTLYPIAPTEASRRATAERLERYSEVSRAAYLAFAAKETDRPRKRCPTCLGTGREENAPRERAGSCSGCRGFRFVDATDDEIRASYRELRRRGAALLETTPRVFDETVRRALESEEPTPGEWLRAAYRLVNGRK